MEWAVLQECCDEYYIADSLNTLYDTIPATCISPRRSGFLLYDMNGQTFYTIPQLYNQAWLICLENESNSETHLQV